VDAGYGKGSSYRDMERLPGIERALGRIELLTSLFEGKFPKAPSSVIDAITDPVLIPCIFGSISRSNRPKGRSTSSSESPSQQMSSVLIEAGTIGTGSASRLVKMPQIMVHFGYFGTNGTSSKRHSFAPGKDIPLKIHTLFSIQGECQFFWSHLSQG
jgi:hypothetical protein